MTFPDAREDLERQPPGGICVRLMPEIADKEDRLRPMAQRVERQLACGENERDALRRPWMRAVQGEAIALREDNGCVDPRGRLVVEVAPGTLVQVVQHVPYQAGQVPEVVRRPQACVVVDEDSWGIELSERLEEDRRREELELDDIGPPGRRQG